MYYVAAGIMARTVLMQAWESRRLKKNDRIKFVYKDGSTDKLVYNGGDLRMSAPPLEELAEYLDRINEIRACQGLRPLSNYGGVVSISGHWESIKLAGSALTVVQRRQQLTTIFGRQM